MNKKEKIKKILLFALMFLLPLISMQATTIDSNNNQTTELSKASIERLLVEEAKTYIGMYYANCPFMVSEYIVKSGLSNDIDICFMLAQSQIETTFGKAGIGRSSSRHSLFGIERKYYKSYEAATDDYIRILKTSYLVKGKTEQNLLKNYVNKSGRRYAGDLRYEGKLRNMYNNIKKRTRINELQNQYRKL